MRRLPLFPLPIVLFPGASLPLHVFEPRYRRMVARCLEGDRRFGLVYHDPDRHGPFAADAPRVGTVARILRFQPLPDGRSMILCLGEERFRIEDGVDGGEPFFEAVVAPYADEAEDAARLADGRRASLGLFERVLREAMDAHDPPPVDLDADVSFQIARTIQIDPEWQQRLLDLRSERERLDVIDALLRSVLDAHARGEWRPGGEVG